MDSFTWQIIHGNHFYEACDALSKEDCINDKQQTTYLKEKGYFIADKFYMVNPYTYLGLEQP